MNVSEGEMKVKKKKKWDIRICEYKSCHAPFYPKREHQKFCNPRCRYKDWMELRERITVIKGTTEKIEPKSKKMEAPKPAIFPFIPNRLRKTAKKARAK